MKNILFVGIGQIGCEIADSYARLTHKADNVRVIAIDTDERTFAKRFDASPVSMAFRCDVKDILDAVDPELIASWFPCGNRGEQVKYFETLPMNTGANMWRMKAVLSLYYYLYTQKEKNSELNRILNEIDPDAETEIHIAASVAGGTGAGLLLPLTLYLKRYIQSLTQKPVYAKAFIALPEIAEDFFTKEQAIKAKANAYAVLRELNAVEAFVNGNSSVSFEMGHPDDKVFGMLFDTSDPRFKAPEQKPFTEIYLFRRMPGFRSVALHTEFIAASAAMLLTETIESLRHGTLNTNTHDEIYAGISVAKTVYPLESIVKYISHAYVSDLAQTQWMALYDTAFKQLPNAIKTTAGGAPSKKVTESIVEAVLYAIDSLCPENENSALLLNRNDQGVSQNAPIALETESYVKALEEKFFEEFRTADSEIIYDFIEEYDNECAEQAASKNGAKRRKSCPDLPQTAEELCDRLVSFYNNGVSLLQSNESVASVLEGSHSNLSLTERVFKENGAFLHPSYSFARLALLYNAIDKAVTRFRLSNPKNKDAFQQENTPIPEYLIRIDTRTTSDSSYSRNGGDSRFRNIIYGDISHIGKKDEDKLLFVYDLKRTVNRVRSALINARLEQALSFVESRLLNYCAFFAELQASVKGLNEACALALSSKSFGTGMYHYIGGSVGEKRKLYKSFCDAAKDNFYLTLERGFDTQLGKLASAFCANYQNGEENPLQESEAFGSVMQEESCSGIAEALFGFVSDVANACLQSEFYEKALNKNVLEILLSQNEKDGGENLKLAVSKTFLTELVSFLCILPREMDTHSIITKSVKDVLVMLPKEAYNYLLANAERFGNAEPEDIIKALMFEAGEYEGRVYFDSALAPNEICIVRKTNRLPLLLLEYANEASENPLYYKAFLQSLQNQEMQWTDMWNPNLICKSSEKGLPLISDS